MSWFRYIIFCNLLILIPFSGRTEDTFKVEVVNKNAMLVPGKVTSLVCKIQNKSDNQLTIKPEVVLPDGLKLTVPLTGFKMNPGEEKIQMISMTVPSRFLAGETKIKIQFRHPISGEVYWGGEFSLFVKEVESISFQMIGMPGYIMGGEPIRAEYLLVNTGNVSRKVKIETFNCNVTTGSAIDLAPGENATVKILAETSKQVSSSFIYSLSVQAYVSESVKIRDFREIKVFPVKEAEADFYFRYPVQLSARYLSRGRNGEFNSGYQFEAYGNGFLDQEKKHKLEFMARGPNNFDLSFLGLYDEYYVSYLNKNYEAFIGSKSFSGTPLTEVSRYGYGFETNLISNKGSRLGFFYVEPRFFREIKKEMAAYAEVKIIKENSIGIHYMAKTIDDAAEAATLASITARLMPFSQTMVDVEYSMGSYLGIKDEAWRINLNSQYRFFSLSGNVIKAGEAYPGYYSNSTFYNGSLNLNISRTLSLNLTAREDFSNASLDTLLSTAPYSRIYQASLNYRLNRAFDLRGYYIRYQRVDRMPVKQFDYQTESMNFWISRNFNKLGYQFGCEFGNTSNFLLKSGLSNRQNSYRLSMNLQYRPSYLFSIQAFTSYTNINSFIASDQKDWLWGMSAFGQITQNLRTNIQVQNSFAIEDYYRNRNLFQVSIDYAFLKNHTLSLQSFYTLFQNQTSKPDYSVSLKYTVAIGIPLKKVREAGSVSGSLRGTGGGPVKGIILYLNGRPTVTGDNGEFQFKSVAPGQYQLFPDMKKSGMDVILNTPMPFIVNIQPGIETPVHLHLVKAARLKGKFKVRESEKPVVALNQEPPKMSEIVIDISDQFESFRIITDAHGRFEFPRLRPGAWKVHIYKNNLDPRYYLEKDTYEINLQPGESGDLEIEVFPRIRNVIFKNSPTRMISEPVKSEKKVPVIENAKSSPLSESDIWFSVQIASSLQKGPVSLSLNGVSLEIKEFFFSGRFKYFTGKFPDLSGAIKLNKLVRTKIPGAFVVAFRGTDPMPLAEAIEITKKDKTEK